MTAFLPVIFLPENVQCNESYNGFLKGFMRPLNATVSKFGVDAQTSLVNNFVLNLRH